MVDETSSLPLTKPRKEERELLTFGRGREALSSFLGLVRKSLYLVCAKRDSSASDVSLFLHEWGVEILSSLGVVLRVQEIFSSRGDD